MKTDMLRISAKTKNTSYLLVLMIGICALLATGIAAQAATNSRQVLAADGKARVVITLASDAIPSEVTAARELSTYLQQMSGARFEVKNESEMKLNAAQILVGAGPAVKKLLPNQKWESLRADGIVIRTAGNRLILAGGRPRGTLYAVYTFLEDTLGVRWWAPGETFVPTKKVIEIGGLNTVYTPRLQTREGWNNSLIDDPWFATRLKVNGTQQRQLGDLGGHTTVIGIAHTFSLLLPIEKYFKDHPEWYSDPENGNKPCTKDSPMPKEHTWQLCLSSEEARQELTRNALELIRANPTAGAISISQNDTPFAAADPVDMALAEREGSPSAPLLKFVNAVAADIEKEFPGFLVETLAYQYSQKPPRTIRARDNVVVRLCSIEANFAHPLNSEANAVFRDDVAGWKKLAKNLAFWNYVANFDHMNVPFPNMRTLAQDIRYFVDSNAISVFEQGDAESNGTGDFVALRVWLVSHLMWNPALDQRKLEDEFLRGYYGAAAPHLRAYLDIMQGSQASLGKDAKLETFNLDYSYLSLDVMNRATRTFRMAEAAVAQNAVLQNRVERERVSLDNAWLRRYNPLRSEATQRQAQFEGPADPVAAVANFVHLAKKHGLKQLRLLTNTASIDDYANSLLIRVQPPAALPQVAQGKAPSDIIDAQETVCRLGFLGTYVEVIDDPKASNGKAARLIGTSYQWAIQFWPGRDYANLAPGPWRCYIIARTQLKAGVKSGHALTFGLYDTVSKKSVFSEDKKIEDLAADGEYHAIDFGLHEISPEMYFYIAKSAGDSVEGVTVDRILLVREPKARP